MGEFLDESEVDAGVLCKSYGSQLHEFPVEILKTLAEPTVIREGKEAFLAFQYGTKKFKVTFEQVDRLRIPKEAK